MYRPLFFGGQRHSSSKVSCTWRSALCNPKKSFSDHVPLIRMPVILSPDHYDLWLDPAFRNTTAVSEMLKPGDATVMRRYPVSTRVSQVQNDDAGCATPIETDSSPSQALPF